MSQKRERPVPFGRAMARWLLVSFPPLVVISSDRFIGHAGRVMAVGAVLPSCPGGKKILLWKTSSVVGLESSQCHLGNQVL